MVDGFGTASILSIHGLRQILDEGAEASMSKLRQPWPVELADR
jgi:hypothetical protein